MFHLGKKKKKVPSPTAAAQRPPALRKSSSVVDDETAAHSALLRMAVALTALKKFTAEDTCVLNHSSGVSCYARVPVLDKDIGTRECPIKPGKGC